MEIRVTKENVRVPVSVMHVNGKIDSLSYQQFQESAEELISDGTRYVVIDLAEAPFVSSAGLRAFHKIFNTLRAIHRDVDDDLLQKKMSTGSYKSPYLKVTNLSEEVRKVFELGGFDTYIETFLDVKEALASF